LHRLYFHSYFIEYKHLAYCIDYNLTKVQIRDFENEKQGYNNYFIRGGIMKRFIYLTAIFLIAVSATACIKKSIKYSMDDVSVLSNSPFANVTLAVKPFEDQRKPLADCSGFGSDIAKIDKDGKTFYYNCDKFYRSDSIALEITKTVTNHMNYSHLFNQVFLSDVPAPTSDYLLIGKVSRFDGLKEYKVGAEIAQGFGLIGALINLAFKSDYEGTTNLDGLQLIRVKDKVVIWEGDVTGHIEGKDTVDPYGWISYQHANLSLKEATNNLINNLVKLNENSALSDNKQNLNYNGVETKEIVNKSQ
jgi:hypothetical protein